MAGRIPHTFIDDLLARVDIVDIIDSRIPLKKTGRNYSACCPFHQEKTPSFSVSPDKQFYYCFGCGVSGNALGFLMAYDQQDFLTAVEALAGQLGLEVPREQQHSSRSAADYADLFALMAQAAADYQRQLQDHPQAANAACYLQQRGLSAASLQRFGIGFAPPVWHHLHHQLGNTPASEQRLLLAGILVKNEDTGQVYDRFRHRVMFPIRDGRGRCIALGGRVLDDSKPKYLNSPESPIFHKGRELYGLYEARQANRSLKSLMVVEGYMDVVVLAEHGITNCVATLGTATTPEHVQRLYKVVSEVTFCFDGDDAGSRAAWRALTATLPHMEDGRQARFLFLPQGEDPDSLIRQEGTQRFHQRLQQQALSLDTLLFKELEKDLDLHTLDGRARLARLFQPYLEKLPEGIFKHLILQQLADRTGLAVTQLAAQLAATTTQQAPAETKASPNRTGRVLPARDGSYASAAPEWARLPARLTSKISGAGYAIRHLLCHPALAATVEATDGLKQDPALDSQLLVKLLDTLQANPSLSAVALIAQWHDTADGERLKHLVTLDLGIETNDREFYDALAQIGRQAQKRRFGHQLSRFQNQLVNTPLAHMDLKQRREWQDWYTQQQQFLAQSGLQPEKK